MPSITQRYIDSIRSATKDQFHRDTRLKGFAVKVTPAGSISFVAEARIKHGKPKRVKLGNHPALSVSEARRLAATSIAKMHSGIDPVKQLREKLQKAKEARALEEALGVKFEVVFGRFMDARNHKATTVRDYLNTVNNVFGDWLDSPIRSISRGDIEQRFIEARDNRGQAQAVKAIRYLSAIMNFAKADEIEGERLINENPCDVLKQKGYDRTVPERDNYLKEEEISCLFSYFFDIKLHPQAPKDGVTKQGIIFILLLLLTGLRKSEAQSLKWGDIDFEQDSIVAHETKNNSDHFIPTSPILKSILGSQKKTTKDSIWVFPARRGDNHMTEPRSQLDKVCRATGLQFSFHDLRRTFATHADVHGADFDTIRRALNHKSGGGVTSRYIAGRIDTLRPVFEAVADQYIFYFNFQGRGKATRDSDDNLVDPIEAQYTDEDWNEIIESHIKETAKGGF